MYLIAYAMPLKQIRLTGKKSSLLEPLGPEEAKQVVHDGRGWTNKNRNEAYDALGAELLFERLGSWSPIVRERAAMALARRGGDPVPALVRMLDAGTIEARLGACAGLAQQKEKAAPAVPALRKLLQQDHLWLRVQAAEALAAIGEAGQVALPDLLKRLAIGPTEADPRAMEQRYLCSIVFGKMLRKSLDGVDRQLLNEAVVAGLQNQDGRARGSVGGIYERLSYDELKPLFPAIREAIVKPAPSGIMFADGVRIAGLKLLAKHRIAEGIPLCFSFLDVQRWNKRSRIDQCLSALEIYGAAAKPTIPQLRQLQKDLTHHQEAKGLRPIVERIDTIIAKIENSNETVELRHLD
jgi:hypothetical protein